MKYVYFIILTIMGLSLYASHVERFKVEGSVNRLLSQKEAQKILDTYNTKQLSIKGIELEITSSTSMKGSYINEKFKEGQKVSIVITAKNQETLKKINVGSELLLEYHYSDYEGKEGVVSTTIWTVLKAD